MLFFADITRRMRNCAPERVIQYSRDVRDQAVKPRRNGSSAFAEYDGCPHDVQNKNKQAKKVLGRERR
jgi:hypothetical protein